MNTPAFSAATCGVVLICWSSWVWRYSPILRCKSSTLKSCATFLDTAMAGGNLNACKGLASAFHRHRNRPATDQRLGGLYYRKPGLGCYQRCAPGPGSLYPRAGYVFPHRSYPGRDDRAHRWGCDVALQLFFTIYFTGIWQCSAHHWGFWWC